MAKLLVSDAFGTYGKDSVAASNAAPSERRVSPRFALLIRAAKLIIGEKEYLCIVRDASVEGVKIRHFGPLPECDILTIELANGETFLAELVWASDSHAGLKFRSGVDLSRLVSISQGDLPKRELRLKTNTTALIERECGSLTALVRNLSQRGALIECHERLARGEMLRLSIEGLWPVLAKVLRRHGTEYGLIFETTLTYEELGSTIARFNAVDA